MRDEAFTEEELLAAACTVYWYEASRFLDVRQTGKVNDVPDRAYFTGIFTFSKDRLLRYIKANPGLADGLLGKADDNRSTPSAYMAEVRGGAYRVGWYDGEYSQERVHHDIESAAADYVLTFWGLSRD